MSTKGTIFLTSENEHWYTELAARYNHGCERDSAFVLEIGAKHHIENLDPGEGVAIVIEEGTELYQTLENRLFPRGKILSMDARDILPRLKRGDCWCEVGVGNPNAKNHSQGCILAQVAMAVGEAGQTSRAPSVKIDAETGGEWEYPWFANAGSWPEDADLENGNYQNVCIECGKSFHGHKRRVTCKTCYHASLVARHEALTGITEPGPGVWTCVVCHKPMVIPRTDRNPSKVCSDCLGACNLCGGSRVYDPETYSTDPAETDKPCPDCAGGEKGAAEE